VEKVQNICQWQKCGTPFMGAKDAKFCSPNHRWSAYKARKKKLSGIEPTPSPTPHTTLHTPRMTPPLPLDIAAQFVIDNLKDQNKDLKDKNKELEKKIETIASEKTALEKEIDRVQNEAQKKPSALNGFLENALTNPDSLANLMNSVPVLLSGLKDFIKSPLSTGTDQKQVAGLPDQNTDQKISQWLALQPENVRTQVVELINILMKQKDANHLAIILDKMIRNSMRLAG
jgi:FtsZ-binding cell division protein ZapB